MISQQFTAPLTPWLSKRREPTPTQVQRRNAYASQMHVPPKIAVQLTPAEILVIAEVGRRAAETGRCDVTTEELCIACSVTRSTARCAVNILKDCGYVEATRLLKGQTIVIVDADWLEWLKDPAGNRARLDRGEAVPGDYRPF